jgi:hypothetical protein
MHDDDSQMAEGGEHEGFGSWTSFPWLISYILITQKYCSLQLPPPQPNKLNGWLVELITSQPAYSAQSCFAGSSNPPLKLH